MAIILSSSTDVVKVISRIDDSLCEVSDEQWKVYQDTLDETHLTFVSGKTPTRFLVKKSLSFAAQKNVANQQMGLGEDGKPEIKIGYILEEVRCALVGIENPADLPEASHIKFSRESDGFASKELIAQLNSVGIVNELFAARQLKAVNAPKK
jgi:hypothetical protein